VEASHSYSSITHPSGETLVEILDKEDIIYADIDISEMITAKQYHDIIGHYTRMDVVSLNLCQDEDRPLWFSTRMKAEAPSETIGLNLSNQLMEIKQDYQSIREESKRMLEMVSQFITEFKKRNKK
jgi:hypothetical protein